ncbi:MAG: hypothetical protein FJ211_10640, partial [Ignavibacteria bacterium]|nr:hypothetical protein [Ignavibacteria bacterium]
MALQHLRSSTADKRPTPGAMSDGQLALNTNLVSPGLFFKDSNGDSVKIGPIHVGATAPNATPGAGGQAGNSKGEAWLDTSATNPILKVWNGSAFVAVQPVGTGTVVSTADTGTVTSTMILDGTILNADVNASAAIAGTKINPDFGSQTIATTGEVRVANINGGPLAGFRNAIINGDMRIAQRGSVSFSNNSLVYGGCDRWLAGCFNFTTATATVRKAGPTGGAVNEIQATTTGTNANQAFVFQQRIEAANVAHLSGQAITVSATLYQDTGSAITPVFNLAKPNAEDTYNSVTYVASTSLASLASLGRVRYEWTVTLGATDANNGLLLEIIFPVAAAITDKYFQIGNVQLEPGPVATPFERRPIGTELSLCQRYFQALGPLDILTSGSLICVMPRADLGSTNENNGIVELKVSMRVAPTVSGSGWQLAGHHNSTPTISTGTQFVVFTYSGADYRASGG